MFCLAGYHGNDFFIIMCQAFLKSRFGLCVLVKKRGACVLLILAGYLQTESPKQLLRTFCLEVPSRFELLYTVLQTAT